MKINNAELFKKNLISNLRDLTPDCNFYQVHWTSYEPVKSNQYEVTCLEEIINIDVLNSDCLWVGLGCIEVSHMNNNIIIWSKNDEKKCFECWEIIDRSLYKNQTSLMMKLAILVDNFIKKNNN